MGIGVGRGDNRAVDAATSAINNPLLEDAHIEGAKGILVNVTGGENFALTEYEEVVKIITANSDSDALIIPGSTIDPSLDDEVKVTVIATGFAQDRKKVVKRAEEPVSSAKSETIRYDEWLKMREGIISRAPRDYLLGRNSPEADLGIPTVLRDKPVGQLDE